jgi:transcriptional regulator with XRE-family HTH domain
MKNAKRNVLCYLRTHRRVWGLTRLELASLFGLRSAGHISRLEHGKRTPSVEVALACQVIFGISPSAMFPHVHTLVEEKVVRNIYRLHLALSNATKLSGLRKRELCSQILKRAISKANKLEGV